MNYHRRIIKLQENMQNSRIDLAIFGASPSYQYLTGLSATWRESRDHIAAQDIVVVPRQGDAIAISSSENRTSGMWLPNIKVCASQTELAGALADIAKTVERDGGKTALDDELKGGVWLAVVRALDNPVFCSASHLLDPVRMRKEDAEVELLRQAGELTDNAIRRSLSSIRQGVSMRELQLEIEFQGRKLGASGVSFQPVGHAAKISTSEKPFPSI